MSEPVENTVENTENHAAETIEENQTSLTSDFPPKKKKQLTELQKEKGRANLAKGREKLLEKKKQQKQEKQEITEEVKKRLAEKKGTTFPSDPSFPSSFPKGGQPQLSLKQPEVSEPKDGKRKKKIVVYEDSDDEEEVEYVQAPRKPQKPSNQPVYVKPTPREFVLFV